MYRMVPNTFLSPQGRSCLPKHQATPAYPFGSLSSEPVRAEPLLVHEQAKRDDVGAFRNPAHRDPEQRAEAVLKDHPGVHPVRLLRDQFEGSGECPTASGPRTTGLPVREAIPHNIPWKTNRCRGDTAAQYRIPPRPFGTKQDRC